MIIKEKIVDLSTGTESVVDHELNAEQVAEVEAAKTAAEAKASEAAAKQAARLAVLEKLGLTADEVAALGL
jgi:hypothetical protein